MVIHLAIGYASIRPRLAVLRKIVDVIHRQGHILARDWIEPYAAMDEKKAQGIDPERMYRLNVDAIERADLLIVEGSEPSFSSGFQIATALSKKKPILLLLQKDGVKSESMFSRGINDPLLRREEYEKSSIDLVVEGFIKENTVNAKDLRFNFVIDRQLYNHIRWKSFNAKKTKAEVVRELLLRDMEDRS